MEDSKYMTEKECKEKMLEHYDFLEDVINSAESSLKSEIRHAAMGIKAYIDKQDKDIKADIQRADEKAEARHKELLEAIKNLKP